MVRYAETHITDDLRRRLMQVEQRLANLPVREPAQGGLTLRLMKVMSEQEDTLTCRRYTLPQDSTGAAVVGSEDIIVAKPRHLRRTYLESGDYDSNRTFTFSANDTVVVSQAGAADETWVITPTYDDGQENIILVMRRYDGVEVDFVKVQWLDMNWSPSRDWCHDPNA